MTASEHAEKVPATTPETGCPVTVVIATRNRRDELESCLRQLTQLPEQPPVIVVDNASSDGTAGWVGEAFPNVRVIQLERNLGAVARNVGVTAAETPYVAFSDDDSWWASGALLRACELFDCNDRLGLLAATTLVGARQRIDPLTVELMNTPLGGEGDLPGHRILGFMACAAVVRRGAFLAAGGFDRVVSFGAEESRLAFDLAAAGWGLCFVPEMVAYHCPTWRPRSAYRERLRQIWRNELLTCWMRRPLRLATRRTARLAWRARRDRMARQALAGALVRLPAALYRRRRLPERVEADLRMLEAGGGGGGGC